MPNRKRSNVICSTEALKINMKYKLVKLIIDSLLSTFLTGPVKALGYADDTLLYITGVDPSTMAQFMQKALDRMLSWGRRNGLSFNPAKTTTVPFTRFRRNVKEPNLWMDGKKLEYSDEMKYLGVTIQKRMSWTKHVNERVRKAGKIMNMVQNVIGQKWGLNPDKTLWRWNNCRGRSFWAPRQQ
jgi:hypothetical protein